MRKETEHDGLHLAQLRNIQKLGSVEVSSSNDSRNDRIFWISPCCLPGHHEKNKANQAKLDLSAIGSFSVKSLLRAGRDLRLSGHVPLGAFAPLKSHVVKGDVQWRRTNPKQRKCRIPSPTREKPRSRRSKRNPKCVPLERVKSFRTCGQRAAVATMQLPSSAKPAPKTS